MTSWPWECGRTSNTDSYSSAGCCTRILFDTLAETIRNAASTISACVENVSKELRFLAESTDSIASTIEYKD